ncbi:MAG: aldehyde dehydrogenase [Rhodospirillaceae bacterium]|nr:aldehyde dehydrogenase [Rhodospirillaceae bacterium]
MTIDTYRQNQLFIGGEWVNPIDGEVVPSIDPSTGKEWAYAAWGGPKDIDRAVTAANEALRGPWSKFTPNDRANLLRRFASLYEKHVERLAELESRDNGLPIRDTKAGVGMHATWYNYYAGLANSIEGRQVPMDAGMHIYTTRTPVGVVGAILPWNAPLQMVVWKLAPVLATGCTIIIKTAEQTPISSYEVAKIVQEAGIPKGVVNIVTGLGPVAGAHLVSHPHVNKIAFTGEHRTAQEIMKGASANLKRLSFECGGKSPHIIFDDANLEQAMNAATHSGFTGCGQSCALGSRLIVQSTIYDKVVAELAARAQKVRIGQALDPKTQMGPHTHQEQLQKTLKYFELGQQEGAKLVTGGKRLTELGDGFFVAPTVFANVNNKMRIAQEEIFGPVVSVIPFKDEDEAVAIANDTIYGLTGALWSQNLGRAHRVAAQIEAGTVWVNTYRYLRWSVPYGGFKISGIGRENGPESLEGYLETKAVYMNLSGNYADYYAQ